MNTYHHLVLLARLAPSVADMGPDDALALLHRSVSDVVMVQPLTRDCRPDFGHDFSYDDRRFRDVSGIAVVDGMARVGIFTQNLAWPYREADQDASDQDQVVSRLDVILARFSRLTVGVPGEVVGAVSNEHMSDFHQGGGRPVVRCRDGVVREAEVMLLDQRVVVDHNGDRLIEAVPLPEVIPTDVLVPDAGGSLLVALDADALLRRFAPIDATPFDPRSLSRP